ncbi:MAG: DUF5687 family protein, partial [Bacteroidales bacterium]|nr:DUF5687 family protein [Bacteroidales bacterium]
GFLLPVLIVWPFNHFKLPIVGYTLIAVIGLTGLVLYKPLLGIVTRQFMSRRYIMAKGFRE